MSNVVCATIRQQFNQANVCWLLCFRFCICFANHSTRTTMALYRSMKLKYIDNIKSSNNNNQRQMLHILCLTVACPRFYANAHLSSLSSNNKSAPKPDFFIVYYFVISFYRNEWDHLASAWFWLHMHSSIWCGSIIYFIVWFWFHFRFGMHIFSSLLFAIENPGICLFAYVTD